LGLGMYGDKRSCGGGFSSACLILRRPRLVAPVLVKRRFVPFGFGRALCPEAMPPARRFWLLSNAVADDLSRVPTPSYGPPAGITASFGFPPVFFFFLVFFFFFPDVARPVCEAAHLW